MNPKRIAALLRELADAISWLLDLAAQAKPIARSA